LGGGTPLFPLVTMRREVGKRNIVGLAVVHQDLALATNAEVLIRGLSSVGHGGEGDM
jgi:hypothetical protein